MSSFTNSPNRFGAPSSPPTSSPASSPSFGLCDSSPPSSPECAPRSLSPPASPGLSHPFAASTKAVRAPPLYEKRVSRGELELGSPSGGDVLGLDDSPSRTRHTTSTSVPHDPLAGDANTAWTPPDWEKKSSKSRRALSVTSTGSSDFSSIPPARLFSARPRPPAYAYDSEAINLSDDESDVQPVYRSRKQREKEIWEEAIEKAVNEADSVINLDNSGLIGTPLTRIPSSVADLASLVVLQPRSAASTTEFVPRSRPFTRSVTVPANPFRQASFLGSEESPRLLKSPSMAQLKWPERSKSSESTVGAITLHLARNQITKLPLELFWLQRLVELNLRGNNIKHMPPQIAQLKNLQTLIISQNKLTYLPAEMLDMRLATLVLQGNPWLPPPPDTHRDEPQRKAVSPTITYFAVPTLTEACLRALLAELTPADATLLRPDSKPGETALEALHPLPLPDDYPGWLLADLRACCARAVAKEADTAKRVRRSASFVSNGGASAPGVREADEDEDAETHPGVGVCRSPAHAGRRAVFVRRAEERFSWEHVVAGRDVSVEGGVPLLWRGCSRGCLNFLVRERR